MILYLLCYKQKRGVAVFILGMKTATSLVAVDRLDKVGCGFYTGYENCNQVAVDRLDKGPSINNVGPFFQIYVPPPSPCRLRLLKRLM